MNNIAFLNINCLNFHDGSTEALAHYMKCNHIAVLALAETRHSTDNSLLHLSALGYRAHLPSIRSAHGGLAFIYDMDLDIFKNNVTYSTDQGCETLTSVFQWNDTKQDRAPFAVTAMYLPPSTPEPAFRNVIQAAFTAAQILRQKDIITTLMMDANAHCLTLRDNLTSYGIPNRVTVVKPRTPNPNTVDKGSTLEDLATLNGYVILNCRAPGLNKGATFQRGVARSVVDYMLVPIASYASVESFTVCPYSADLFGTDHNLMHLESVSTNETDTTTPPDTNTHSQVDPGVPMFPKHALTQKRTQQRYNDATKRLFKLWCEETMPGLLDEHAMENPQVIIDLVYDAFLATLRQAATIALGTLKPAKSKASRGNMPRWWTKEMDTLTANAKFLTSKLAYLDNTATSTPAHASQDVMTAALDPITRDIHDKLRTTRQQIRRLGNLTKIRLQRHYYHVVNKYIHKSKTDRRRSNKLVWLIVHGRRRDAAKLQAIPASMRMTGGLSTDTIEKTGNLITNVWKSISAHRNDDPRFNQHSADAEEAIFKLWRSADLAHFPAQTEHQNRPFTDEETATAQSKLKSYKRHGRDGIPPDLLKHGSPWLTTAVTRLHNLYLTYALHPTAWNVCPAIPLHKKGRVTDPLNYRIIAFMSAMCKLYDGCLTSRLQEWVDKEGMIAPTQYGYRCNSECVDMWYVYSLVIRERKAQGLTTLLASLDVKKAFPSVPRYFIWNMCHSSGMQGRTLLAIIQMAENAQLWIVAPGTTPAHAYPLEQGVREGGLSSPLLYIIFANASIILIKDAGLGIIHNGVYIGANMFADDISLLMETTTQMNDALNLLHHRGVHTRTSYNEGKTAVLIFSPTVLEYVRIMAAIHQDVFTMGGIRFKPVQQLTLLGVRCTNRFTFHPQLQYLIAQVSHQTADLVLAGAHSQGLDMKTCMSMWHTIFLPKFTSSLHIWFAMDYSERLDEIILAPIRRLLHPVIKCGSKSADNLMLLAEYRILPSYLIRVLLTLTHDIRLRLKKGTNAAAAIHEIRKLMNPMVPEQAWIHNWRLMLKWNDPLRPDGTTIPNWEDTLDEALSSHVLDLHHANRGRSHNAQLHQRLLSLQARGDRPFYQSYPESRQVLMLRLQTAPLATHQYNSESAPCRRCISRLPDTLAHFLWHCLALAIQRGPMLRKLALWIIDMTTHTGLPAAAWHALSSEHQQNAMMGVVPNFLGAEQNAGNRVLMCKLVFILETFCKLTFTTAHRALSTSRTWLNIL